MQGEKMHRFFGYGSLVNRKTHAYPQGERVTVAGWRRAWRHTTFHPAPFLTAVPDPTGRIDGLSAEVPGGDWVALDRREAGYLRQPLPEGPSIYHIPEDLHPAPDAAHPILLSYLDVVVQGYLAEYGEQGVERFFRTTDGWDAPIRDDRAAPVYPRAQTLTLQETGLVDDWLRQLHEAPLLPVENTSGGVGG
ncbi:gamma-glutamylcyclotransferase family protein [Jannaschia rubra]|uniref:gamma-glutamylcyclotransferase family protein n=1 Tax=Jannaschia rubra TaxID=282197 RepID=UPI00248F9112|nr:gamma-glutamylcyclotransferase family protein [Jannaschia rubra]